MHPDSRDFLELSYVNSKSPEYRTSFPLDILDPYLRVFMLLLLLSHFSHVRLCATP